MFFVLMKSKITILVSCLGLIAAGCAQTHFFVLSVKPQRPIIIKSIDFQREIADKHWKSLVDVAADAFGNSYVLDASTHKVFVFDPNGKILLEIGEAGFFKKTFPRPSGIAVSREGRIFVSDTKNDNVHLYDHSGAFNFSIGEKGSETGNFREPAGIDVDNEGGLYVADEGNRRVQKFNANGAFLMQIISGPKNIKDINISRTRGPIKFTSPPEFNRIIDVAVGPQGTIYALDQGNYVVHAYGQAGEYLFSFGGRSRRNGKFQRPSGITVGNLGVVCVSDEEKNTVQLFDSTGRFLISLGSEGKGRGQFKKPVGIAATSGGLIFVADRANRRVQVFSFATPAKETTDTVPTLEKPVRIAIFDLKNNNPAAASRGYGQSISEMFITAFANRPNFEVIERKQLKKVLDEIYFDQSGIVETETAKKVGKILGVDVALVGGVAAFANSIQIDLRLLDIETGKVIIADSIEAEGESQLRALVNREVIKLEKNYAILYGAPRSPTGLNVECAGRGCSLSWNANKEPDFKGYRIYRSSSLDDPYTVIAETKKTEWIDRELPYGATCYYLLTAVDESGLESKRSSPVKGETLGKPSIGRIGIKSKVLVKKTAFSWDENEQKVSGYLIQRAASPDGPFTEVGKSRSPKFSESGLGDGDTYYYRIVKKYRGGLESKPSEPFSVTTEARPSIPEGLKTQSGLARRVKLEWAKPDERDISKFILYRSSAADGPYKKIATVKYNWLSSQSYVDRGLEDNTTYYYKIQAVDTSNLPSPMSAPVEAATKPSPAKPRGLVAASDRARGVPLEWERNPEKDITKYLVFFTDRKGGAFLRLGSTPENRFIHRNLKDKSTYYYKIKALDRDNLESGFSNTVSATTKPRPVQPTGLEAESGLVKSVRLTWSQNPESDIDSYHIYRRAGARGTYEEVGRSGSPIYVDRGLLDGQKYQYTIKAVDVEGLSSDSSNKAEASTKRRPSRPRNLTAEAKSDRIVLQWDKNSEPDIAGYEILRTEKGLWKLLGKETKIGEVIGISFEDRTAQEGKRYNYSIVAFDKTGLHSDRSKPVSSKIPTPKNKR
jgi:fibronectin type 3 domain-containing protein/TolB-like protein